jgi:uncharacterized membrane protein YccF (DUF307 family)
MTPMALLLNLLWLLFGGVWMAVAWGVAAVIMAITIIGLPWARAAFNIGVYTLLPFGFKAVERDEHFGRGDIGTGPLGVIGNIVWLVLAGWWLALGHVLVAIVLGITIIGIPFAWAHLKLAAIVFGPSAKSSCPRRMLRLDILDRDSEGLIETWRSSVSSRRPARPQKLPAATADHLRRRK